MKLPASPILAALSVRHPWPLLLAWSLVLAACEEPPRQLEEACIVCNAGRGYWDGCGSRIELACVEGLYCNDTNGACSAYAGVGDDCNDSTDYLCDPSLVCFNLLCAERLADGAACVSSSVPCETNSFCNGGGAPEDPRAGTCTPVDGSEGASCAWFAREENGRWDSRGCAEGLACVPDVELDPAAAAATHGTENPCPLFLEDLALGDDGCLGWPGHCAAPGLLERGAPCVDDRSCASGLCVVLAPPRVEVGNNAAPLHAPWPGVCAGPADVVPNGECSEMTGCGMPCEEHADCLAGTLCSGTTCWPKYVQDLGDGCGAPDTPPHEDFCGVGLACQQDTWGYGTCRLEGSGTDGASCMSHEDCAAHHNCAHGQCALERAAGEACDYALRCAAELDCSMATHTCTTPGTLGQGVDCAAEPECGVGLYCSPETGRCEGRAGLGYHCTESYSCDVGLVCVVDVATGNGTCTDP